LGKIEKKSKRKKKDLKFHPDGIVNDTSHRAGISENPPDRLAGFRIRALTRRAG
jgi:hypothetical protein